RRACCSAFATADLSTLWICRAASFFENRRIAYASGTARPRIWSTTRRILRADWRTVRWIARASMPYAFPASAAAAASRSWAEPLAECPRNSRVAANSPKRCPTMFSVIETGMNLFPLCTASVCPTKSGVMVLRRDQVLNTFFSFRSFRAWIFLSSDGSTYGPLRMLRPMRDSLRSLRRLAAPAPAHDQLRGRLLLMPRLTPLHLAPGVGRRPAARGLPLAAPERVVHRVHRPPAHPRSPAEPAGLPRLPHRQQ